MKNRTPLIFFILVFLGACSGSETISPTAQDGVLDLRGVNWAATEAIYLDGDWDFFWDTLVPPHQIAGLPADAPLEVPYAWNELEIGDIALPGVGLGTYRLEILLGEAPPAELSLKAFTVRSAYRLFVNERLLFGQGTPGDADYQPGVGAQEASFAVSGDTLRLVVHVANQEYSHGGIIGSMQLTVESGITRRVTFSVILLGCLAMTGFYHMVLFLVFKKEVSSLYFGFLCLCFVVYLSVTGLMLLPTRLPQIPYWVVVRLEFGMFYLGPWLLVMFFSHLFPKDVPGWLPKVSGAFSGFFLLSLFIPNAWYLSSLLPVSYLHIVLVALVLLCFTLPRALLYKRYQARLFLLGLFVLVLCVVNDILLAQYIIRSVRLSGLGMLFFILIQSLATAFRLGGTFSDLSRLTTNLELRVLARVRELEAKNKVVEDQRRDISLKTDSLTTSLGYAQSLQEAASEPVNTLKKLFKDAFIFNKPCDLVSGDFYLMAQVGTRRILIVADCTGHGLPGAFMTAMGRTLLNQVIHEERITDPGSILSALEERVVASFHTDVGGKVETDGMDMGVLVIEPDQGEFRFAGAKMELLTLHNFALDRIPGHRYPIGGEPRLFEKVFHTQVYPLEPGMRFYLYSDGYKDQFGGPDNKKYLAHRFRTLLVQTAPGSMDSQCHKLEVAFRKWQGSQPQTDDVLVVGVSW